MYTGVTHSAMDSIVRFVFFSPSDLSSQNHTRTFNISAQIGGLITQQCIHGQERLPVQNRMLKRLGVKNRKFVLLLHLVEEGVHNIRHKVKIGVG